MVGRKFAEEVIDRSELARVDAQERAQSSDLRIPGSVWMDADGPKAVVPFDGSPKLLRNPCETAANKRRARKAVGQQRNPLSMQRLECVASKPWRGATQIPGLRSMAAQNLQPCSDPGSLRCCGDAGKLRGARAGRADCGLSSDTNGGSRAGQSLRPQLQGRAC